ncbi:hypothetical protein D3C77_618960 [compost metagenome]
MPENIAIATSVASDARISTLDCKARLKHMIEIPQSILRVPSMAKSPDSGSNSSKLAASMAIAASRKPLGKRSL